MVVGTAPNLDAARPLTWEHLAALLSSPHPVLQSLKTLPGSGVLWRYIKSSHQNDPARTFLELLLFLFVVYTWLKSRTRGDKSGRNFVKLSGKASQPPSQRSNCCDCLYTDAAFPTRAGNRRACAGMAARTTGLR